MNPIPEDPKREFSLSRRDFIRTSMAAGTGLLMTGPAILHGQASSSVTRDLKVAIIGTGSQGRVLLEACAGIPNIQFVAVCDMWDYSLRYGQGILRKRGFKPTPYEDYNFRKRHEWTFRAHFGPCPGWWRAPNFWFTQPKEFEKHDSHLPLA